MIQFSPTINVRRLTITRNEHVAYDEAFHSGINIIRGQNSSGKSTILNSIFYALGGDLTHWSDTAELCTHVILEASFNGKVATLRREISTKSGRPMDIASGSKPKEQDWLRFPYKRSESRESFSQAIFRLLDLPEVANEASGNLTMHQVLRLLYADQMSPISSIFKDDGQFDTALIRETVGSFLAGLYDETLYENELKVRDLAKELEVATAELRSLFAVLNATDVSVTLDWFHAQKRALDEKSAALTEEISKAERQAYVAEERDKLGAAQREMAYSALQEAQEKFGEARQKLSGLKLEIDDSEAFIRSLEGKISALQDSATTADQIGDVRFEYCPACYAPISSEEIGHACHLCKTPYDLERARSKITALINDAAIQLKQSTLLQKERLNGLAKLESDVKTLSDIWRNAAARFSELQQLPSTGERDRLRELTRQSGYLDREREDLQEKAKIISLVQDLSERKADLSGKIASLRSKIEASKLALEKRRARAFSLISDETVKFLHHDLPRQDSFETAKQVEFSFAADRMTVDGHNYFSASSQAYLKNSFFMGFLSAAMLERFFRHPRFCIIDIVEDKGIEPERSRNLQNLMVKLSKQTDVDHQVILATAMIAPDLDTDEFTVGRPYTREHRSLNIGR